MKKAGKILLILLLMAVVAAGAVLIYFRYFAMIYDKDGMIYEAAEADVKKYMVYCDRTVFQDEAEDGKYQAGSRVELFFPASYSDVQYEFWSIGAQDLDVSYDEETGYTIRFIMPKKFVSVYYRVAEPFEGIDLAFDENPTTGFEWEYTVEPEGIIEVVEDRYESDPYDGEPVDGLGGTHYWKFKVIGSGEVELSFQCLRGGEELYNSALTYRYACDNGKAERIEETTESDF